MDKSKTALANRVLWVDGVSEVEPERIIELLERGVPASLLSTTKATPELAEFNKLTDSPITVKTELSVKFPPAWTIPERYKLLDLEAYLLSLADRIEVDQLYEQRLQRLVSEIDTYLSLGYHDVLRLLIYIVDTLKAKRQVWGVGRGSSCSSYLLYLLGLHEVDCVLYDVPLSDFIR